jgi:hypothetical protein
VARIPFKFPPRSRATLASKTPSCISLVMSSEPSPGSTTLDILRAYSHPASSSSPDATGSTNRPPDIDLSVQPPDSRFSTLSYSPTSILFTADKGLSSETNESPFRWNLPSPEEPEENGPLSGGGRGQLSEPTVHIWQGWRVVVFGSCECITVYLFLTHAKLDRRRV